MDTSLTVGLADGIFPVVVVIFSIILHEIAHGYAAYSQGDMTAYKAGRLTLNPFKHLDMFGSVIVPFLSFAVSGTFFGWAKPVPYNPHVVSTRKGEFLVASAGVFTNMAIALIAVGVFAYMSHVGILTETLARALFTIVFANMSLAFFNLIPFPPFDGMSMLQALYPRFKIKSPFVYSPLFMIGVIVIATVLYDRVLAPFVYYIVAGLLG